ncbi:MAG: YifB family Mg chelatase-like AAA ATPase [Pseudomonadota bacterium]
MVNRITTFAFEGIEAKPVDVQVHIMGGQPTMQIVGLPSEAVAESRDRVQCALSAMGLALPPKRVVVNLAPADLPKEGSHYDAAIALALLVAVGVLPSDALDGHAAMGELALDGALAETVGVLPAAMAAQALGLRLICPAACGSEAAWAGEGAISAPSLIALVNHFTGNSILPSPTTEDLAAPEFGPDLRDVKGQEGAKRVLEIAAAGGHNAIFCGPPGSGKTMLAERLPGLLPALSPRELLEVSQIQSVAGLLERGRLSRRRPFRAPHHSASMAAMVGGGVKAKPGEVSLAHHGVLFLDELPEFPSQVLDSLRQPLEGGEVMVARANRHVKYPARFQLVGAMNPCKCGGGAGDHACRRMPACAIDYQARLSGPFIDRIDLFHETPAVTATDLTLPPAAEGTPQVAARVAAARDIQTDRYSREAGEGRRPVNADARVVELERVAQPDAKGSALLDQAIQRFGLTARGYHRVLKVARTIADLEGHDAISRIHVAEALSYRRRVPGTEAKTSRARVGLAQ